MAADHSARGSMKTGVKPETVCELQDTNDHRQVERKWRLPISVGKLSALEGRLTNLRNARSRGRFVICCYGRCAWHRPWPTVFKWRRLKCQFWRRHSVCSPRVWRPCPDTTWRPPADHTSLCSLIVSTSGVLDYALNLSISLSAGKETKWDSHSNGE